MFEPTSISLLQRNLVVHEALTLPLLWFSVSMTILPRYLSQLELKDEFLAERASLKNLAEWRKSIEEHKKKGKEQK
jgi:hypothetical protein